MKNKLDARSLLVGALLSALILVTVAATTSQRTAWEYKTYYYNSSHPSMKPVNQLGAEGWEMVGQISGKEGKNPGFVFKRPR